MGGTRERALSWGPQHAALRPPSRPRSPGCQHSHGVGAVATKNCEPFVLGPELAMLSTPAPVCFSSLVISSSNFPPCTVGGGPAGAPPKSVSLKHWCAASARRVGSPCSGPARVGAPTSRANPCSIAHASRSSRLSGDPLARHARCPLSRERSHRWMFRRGRCLWGHPPGS